MPKYTKTTVTQLSANEQAALDQINKNFEDIQTAIADTVSRSGAIPSHMTNDLDMNGKRILNVPAPKTGTDLVRQQDVVGDIATVQQLVNATTNAAAQTLKAAQEVQEIMEDTHIGLVADDLALGDNSTIHITANNMSSVSAVALNINAINTCNLNTTNISTVASNISNVNYVGNNINNVNTCASNMAAILDAPNQASAAAGSANDASGYASDASGYANAAEASAQAAATAAANVGLPLLWNDWFEYLLNDQRFLRADTFSWHDGTVYSNAYNHLVDDIDGKTPTTETVGGTTVTYYLADDGHKIVDIADVSAIETVYVSTGVAWYYVLDTANTRFKLPRENPAREELLQVVRAKGNGITLGLTDGTYYAGAYGGNASYLNAGQNAYGKSIGASGISGNNIPNNDGVGITTDPTKSGIISDMTDSTSVYKGNKYLYFYVGQFSQSATEQTAGLNSELFNGKMDLDLGNATAATKETIVGWGMPDYSSGISVTYPTSSTPFVAPKKGILVVWIVFASSVNRYLYINGVKSSFVINNTSGYQDNSSITVPLDAGDSVYFDQVAGTTQELGFYPFKGV